MLAQRFIALFIGVAVLAVATGAALRVFSGLLGTGLGTGQIASAAAALVTAGGVLFSRRDLGR